MRVSTKQKEFLESIYDPTDQKFLCFFECFRHESRTAISLHNKGLIEFHGEDSPYSRCETFFARLTDEGRKIVDA